MTGNCPCDGNCLSLQVEQQSPVDVKSYFLSSAIHACNTVPPFVRINQVP